MKYFLRLFFLLFSLYSIHRGYSILFENGYIVGDELLNNQPIALERGHAMMGILFILFGFYLLYWWIISLIKK